MTQNTSWVNVEKALLNLRKIDAIDPKKISSIDDGILKDAIRPAGYFNQKAKKLKIFAEFFMKNKSPTREQLLDLWGIGPETADSILLYAYKKNIFVIDAYTKRIMKRVGFKEEEYDELQKLFMDNLDNDHKVFNEYHALLVELAKRNCFNKNPDCESCVLNKLCEKKI